VSVLFGLIVAVPTVVLAGPVYGSFTARHIHARAPQAVVPDRVKEYLGTTVKETILSWSGMETIISVMGLLGVLLLSVSV